MKRFGALALSEIDDIKIIKARDYLRRTPIKWKKGIGGNQGKRSNSAVNGYITCLKAILSYCCDDKRWIEVNPTDRVKLLSVPKTKVRCLTDVEWERLKQAIKDIEIQKKVHAISQEDVVIDDWSHLSITATPTHGSVTICILPSV